MARLALAALAVFLPSVALATPETVLAEAGAACSAEGGGVFASEGAVREIDLNADGTLDTVVDQALFTCSTANFLFAGTGGSEVHFFVNGTQTVRLAQGWDTADWSGLPLVLVSLDGFECGGAAPEPCVETLTWGDGGFRSVRPMAE